MANHHGDFVWYELMTTDPDGARAFYRSVVGWTIDAAPSGPIDYQTIAATDGSIGGLLPLTPEMIAGGARPAWLGYVAVHDLDKAVTSVTQGGGRVHLPPRDIPGAGRIAMVADPQGAAFYLIEPRPPAGSPAPESKAFSYDRPRVGHCAWNELATSDPAAAFHFYGPRFGWVKDGEMDMGGLGKYQFLRHVGRAPDGSPMGHGMFGAIMPKPPQLPVSAWTYYFRVADIDAATAQIAAHGGQVLRGPDEVPGGDFSVNAVDPQGAAFALVGSRRK